MAKTVTKASSNMYCKARLAAAKFNDAFNSREGAAEYLGISKDALTKYELDLCKVVPVDAIVMMAEVYNAPELLNNYCTKECPIGASGMVSAAEVKSIELITLRMLNTLRDVEKSKDELLEIVQDGIIEEDEKEQLKEIIKFFEKVEQNVCELKLWAYKNLK